MLDKPHRSIQEIQADFSNECARLGEAHFKISALEADCVAMTRKLASYNVEFRVAEAHIKKLEADAQMEAQKASEVAALRANES